MRKRAEDLDISQRRHSYGQTGTWKDAQSLIIREMEIKTTVRYHFTPVRMAIIKKSTINAREGVGKGNRPTLLVGINYYEEQYGGSLKKN